MSVSASSFDYLMLGIVSCSMEAGTPLTSASLEAIGMRIGEKLVERATRPLQQGEKPDGRSAQPAERGRFSSPVEALRFVCRDIWKLATRRSADNLSITKRGEWLVLDNAFSWISHVSKPHGTTGLVDFPPLGKLQPQASSAPAAASASAGAAGAAAAAAAAGSSSATDTPAPAQQAQQETKDVNAPYLMVFMGLLKGALANLGIAATVSVRSVQGQAVTFSIKDPSFSESAVAAAMSSESTTTRQ